jgi:hypothetical protein
VEIINEHRVELFWLKSEVFLFKNIYFFIMEFYNRYRLLDQICILKNEYLMFH